MASIASPYGLKAVRHASGGNVQSNEYLIAPSYTTAIFYGDTVKCATDGTIVLSAAGDTANIGVFCGCNFVDAQGNQRFSPHWPGTANCTNIKALVYDDPQIVFQAQSATVIAQSGTGTLVDLSTYVAGNTRTGNSLCTIDGESSSATTGKTFRVLRIVDAGAFTDVEVMFVEHALKGVVAGVGGV